MTTFIIFLPEELRQLAALPEDNPPPWTIERDWRVSFPGGKAVFYLASANS